MRRVLLLLCGVLFYALGLKSGINFEARAISASSASNQQVMAKLSHFAVPWIPNLGQLKNKDILYYTNLLGGAVAITKDAVYYYFYDDKNIHVIKEKYIGAKEFRVKPGKKAQAKVNYFVGKRSNWKSC